MRSLLCDLAHGLTRPRSHIYTAPRVKSCKKGRGHKGEEAKEEESGGGFCFTTSVCLVVRATGDLVALKIVCVATRLNSQDCCGGHSSAEKPEGICNINPKHNSRVDFKALIEGCEYQVYKREHGEDGYEQIIVDNRRVGSRRACNHVANKGHDNQRTEELEPA